jgi:hypothetical protein
MKLAPPNDAIRMSVMGGRSTVTNSDGTVTATDPTDVIGLLSAGWGPVIDPSDTPLLARMRLDAAANSGLVALCL